MTVAELIRGAFRVIGVLAAGETPTAQEQSDALVMLNDMLDSWANERLSLYATVRTTYTLTVGTNPHTIGDGGTIDTARPVRIDRASVFGEDFIEQPIRILSDQEFQEIPNKLDEGMPRSLWIESKYPLMNLWLHPIPNTTSGIVLYTWQTLGRFSSVNDEFDMPPGYARTVRFNLAKELAPEFGVEMSATALDTAESGLSALKRNSQKPSYLRCDPAILPRKGGGAPMIGFSGVPSGGDDDLGGLW